MNVLWFAFGPFFSWSWRYFKYAYEKREMSICGYCDGAGITNYHQISDEWKMWGYRDSDVTISTICRNDLFIENGSALDDIPQNESWKSGRWSVSQPSPVRLGWSGDSFSPEQNILLVGSSNGRTSWPWSSNCSFLIWRTVSVRNTATFDRSHLCWDVTWEGDAWPGRESCWHTRSNHSNKLLWTY
jgi:hypothetical protein